MPSQVAAEVILHINDLQMYRYYMTIYKKLLRIKVNFQVLFQNHVHQKGQKCFPILKYTFLFIIIRQIILNFVIKLTAKICYAFLSMLFLCLTKQTN